MTALAIGAFAILAFFSFLAFWRLHPVLFLAVAGVAMETGLYTPHLMSGDVSTPLSQTIGLMIMLYSLVCIGFGYYTLFQGGEDKT